MGLSTKPILKGSWYLIQKEKQNQRGEAGEALPLYSIVFPQPVLRP